jgi:hypothetical protein
LPLAWAGMPKTSFRKNSDSPNIMRTAIYEWFKGLDSQAIGNLISTFTALIAIAGLIYQSRATQKQVKLQNFIEYTKRYQEIILNFPENINEQNFSFDPLSPEIKNKTMRYMRTYFDLCFEEFTLHEKEFIDNDFWQIWKGGMEVAFSKSAFKQAWATIKIDTEFSDGFNTFVENQTLLNKLKTD